MAIRLLLVLLFLAPAPLWAQYWTRLPSDGELQSAADTYASEMLKQRRQDPCHISSSETHRVVKLHHKTDSALFLAHLDLTLTTTRYEWDFRARDCNTAAPPVTASDDFNAVLMQDASSGAFTFGTSLAPLENWLTSYDEGWSAQAPTGKPPCPAAVRQFGLNPQAATASRWDLNDLRGQFAEAIARYNAENAQQTYATDNVMGVLPAISWLAHQGGTLNVVSKQFVFASDADRERWQRARTRTLPDTDAGVGTERALQSAIYSASKAAGRKLHPGDVFYLALQQRQGNVKDALLLAHNTLRSMARVNDNELTDVSQDIPFINDYLEQSVVQRNDLQNAGIWYHLFGTAYFEMQARGEWGVNTLAQLTVDGGGDLMFDALQEMHEIYKTDPTLQIPQNRSSISVLANQVEQLYRKLKDSQADDPDKYCYNVYGAQLGAWLYREKLPAIGGKAPASTPPPGETMTIFGPLPASVTGVVISSSPLNLVWEGNGYRMTLDQASGQLSGYYPLKLIPYLESDGSWGVLWEDQLGQPYRVQLQASADGAAHLTRVQDGEVSIHPITLTAGERLTLEVDGALQLTRADGELIGAIDPAASAAAAPVEVEAEPIQAEAPMADQALAEAQREYEAAYSAYTTLATTGGEGNIEEALARYKAAYARLQALKAERGER
ncbi:MAG: hypothetical protein U1F26_09230 [Lysobacterales bacterium]